MAHPNVLEKQTDKTSAILKKVAQCAGEPPDPDDAADQQEATSHTSDPLSSPEYGAQPSLDWQGFFSAYGESFPDDERPAEAPSSSGGEGPQQKPRLADVPEPQPPNGASALCSLTHDSGSETPLLLHRSFRNEDQPGAQEENHPSSVMQMPQGLEDLLPQAASEDPTCPQVLPNGDSTQVPPMGAARDDSQGQSGCDVDALISDNRAFITNLVQDDGAGFYVTNQGVQWKRLAEAITPKNMSSEIQAQVRDKLRHQMPHLGYISANPHNKRRRLQKAYDPFASPSSFATTNSPSASTSTVSTLSSPLQEVMDNVEKLSPSDQMWLCMWLNERMRPGELRNTGADSTTTG